VSFPNGVDITLEGGPFDGQAAKGSSLAELTLQWLDGVVTYRPKFTDKGKLATDREGRVLYAPAQS